MAKVLVIGSGGREHVLAWKFSQSKFVDEVFVAPGNAGMCDVATCVNIGVLEFDKLIEFVKSEEIDLTFVGPEIPLCEGIVDAFEKEGLNIFGPSKAAAQIEGSKCFSKDLMAKYNVPTAEYASFTDYESAKAYLDTHPAPIVLKADGLAAGKGVIVAMDDETAQTSLKEMMCDDIFGEAGASIVIEEYLDGEEFSLFAFVNGEDVVPMQIAQDHKRAFDNDEGLNTGGMGAYTPVNHLPVEAVQEAVEKVMKPIAKAMVTEGIPYRGLLYGGLMWTKNGVKTIEFNVRFGDPESEVILQALENDLYEVVCKVMNHEPVELTFSNDFFVGVVLAANGYPQKYTKNVDLSHVNASAPELLHMGTKNFNKNLVSAGGRVLFASGRGSTLEEAKQRAYELVKDLECDGLFYRSDIANKGLMRMETLKKRILDSGIIKTEDVLIVDSFINHQMDPMLFMEMANEWKRRFEGKQFTKILTIEASGIGIATVVGAVMKLPVLFAKKTASISVVGDIYSTKVYSYTREKEFDVYVSQKYLNENDKVFIIDDFLANGCALEGLISLVEQAGGSVEGIGIAIEKGYQKGGDIIRGKGYDLQSLAIIDSMDPVKHTINFR